jgi:hypothetical protein
VRLLLLDMIAFNNDDFPTFDRPFSRIQPNGTRK